MTTAIHDKHTLIITSTVYVSSDMTVLTDPQERQQQYVESILFYLNSPMLGAIIVCDNSGVDFSAEQRLTRAVAASGKSCEFLAFVADKQLIRQKGKGYGEGLMMEYVFGNSRLLQEAGPSVLKVTGRLCVLNFDSIVSRIGTGKTYFHRVGLNPFQNRKKVDTRFYCVNRETFSTRLMNAYKTVDDKAGRYLEHAYYEALRTGSVPYSGFGIPPLFTGISGSTGQSYSIGPVKQVIGKLLNYLSGGGF
jgi:hypothetical protein